MYADPSMACVVLVHAFPDLVKDTLESIFCHVTDKVIVLVDAAGWHHFEGLDLSPAKVVKGFYHGRPSSPYRNSMLGVKLLYEHYPDVRWYCYTEYDTVFVNSGFRKNLRRCNAWVVGAQLRLEGFKATLLDDILQHKRKIRKQYKFVGACMFLYKEFLKTITESGFVDRFLAETEKFKSGDFPGKNTYGFEEALWPTIAARLGGKIKEVASFDKHFHMGYRGDSSWAVRFRPKLGLKNYKKLNPSIIHPLKKFNDEVRVAIRKERHKEFGKFFL